MDTLVLLWLAILCSLGTSWAIEPLTTGAAISFAVSAIWSYIDKTPCRLIECCDKFSIDTDAKNITELERVLEKSVYGQHLMQDIVIKALRGHMRSSDPAKALVLSFHGTPGSGKSYVSEFIAQSLYVKGMRSKFVRKFVGGKDFPEESKAQIYSMKIQDEIRAIVRTCERALFIFEDVQNMPAGVLSALVPFIDHHTVVDGLDFRKSIFILLSNTGYRNVNEKALELWTKGTQREDIIKLKDFEPMIRQGAFNDKGGLYQSPTISSSLIDHYIPFLPLEEKHVRLCIQDAFKKFGYTIPPVGSVEKILADMTFIPPGVELYSLSGCKRVESKVTAYVYGEKFTLF